LTCKELKPSFVLLAQQMAVENSGMIRAECVEATEFLELFGRFEVIGVPQITIYSDMGMIIGAVPENQLLSEIY
jgi:hypothetical protein